MSFSGSNAVLGRSASKGLQRELSAVPFRVLS